MAGSASVRGPSHGYHLSLTAGSGLQVWPPPQRPRPWMSELGAWLFGKRIRVRIEGLSMLPTLKPGTWGLAAPQLPLSVGDMVVFFEPQQQLHLVKRIYRINGRGYWVCGDNLARSRDSREFGWVRQEQIVGKLSWWDFSKDESSAKLAGAAGQSSPAV